MAAHLPRTVALVCALLLVSASAARAQDTADGTGALALSTTTLLPLTTTGVAVAVILLVRDDPAAAEEHAELARLYLRQNAVGLAQDLATGEGPVIEELATALQLRRENVPVFRELVRKDRRELGELADPDRLDRQRALQFVRRLHTLLTSHAGLREDLERRASLVR